MCMSIDVSNALLAGKRKIKDRRERGLTIADKASLSMHRVSSYGLINKRFGQLGNMKGSLTYAYPYVIVGCKLNVVSKQSNTKVLEV